MNYTRREFGLLTLAGLALPVRAFADTIVGGVRLGVQSYSFRELPRTPGGDATAAIIQAMKGTGLSECELWAPQIEPVSAAGRGASAEERQQAREVLRRWRLDTPLDHFRGIRKQFESAGLSIAAYNYSPGADFTDEEIDRGFEMTKALGAGFITSSTTLAVARRIRTGTFSINGGNYFSPDSPFGGYKQSGIGREMGRAGLEEFLETKTFATVVPGLPGAAS